MTATPTPQRAELMGARGVKDSCFSMEQERDILGLPSGELALLPCADGLWTRWTDMVTSWSASMATHMY